MKTRYALPFSIPVSQSTLSNRAHPDKAQLYASIVAMRQANMTFEDIAAELGLSAQRVGYLYNHSLT